MSVQEEQITNVPVHENYPETRGNNEPTEDDRILVDNSYWMIRPCSVYDSEKWECLRPRGRFYQYYIEGGMVDCNEWLTLMKDCRKWKKKDDIAAGARIIRHEKELVKRRVEARLQNDVWTRREERPPPNWNDPLPPHIAKQQENSFLSDFERELLPELGGSNSWCSIS